MEEPRSYPLVLRTAAYRWLQPATGIVLAVLTFALFAPLIGQAVLAVAIAVDHDGAFAPAFNEALDLDPVTWQGLLYLNLLLAFLVPATWAIVRLVHGVSGKFLMSVKPGIRWRFFWACAGLALVAVALQLTLGAILGGDQNSLSGSANKATGTLLAMGLVVLLTTPFQAMGEEFLFRGYLMQAFGALTRRPWVAVLLTSLLFALAHGVQNAPLFLDRLSFGLMAGYVVVRTGGLEAGIALHVWNNLFAFGLALGLGDITETLNVEETSWANLPLSLVQNGSYLLLVVWLAHRMRITPVTDRPVLLPAQASV
ncbi:membrane protease YdiL (CAAX protease family) [Marmoricola sp. OAE513]|uniref:CPBP family intramembrane glutamic endopeptidase n=1 Tax=Marmoricola sp. OAE513 TaxID=2817894 RepID=UPI001AE254DF